ncbi:unnamed protein product, partial [Leptidea sinapis]
KELVDFIADYLENIRDFQVYPSVQPGYLHKRLPTEAPQHPEQWDDIFKDVKDHIMPGASSPAGTELETIAMNWLGKLLGLPECFLNEKNDSCGGGVI